MEIKTNSKFEVINFNYFVQNRKFKVELWQKIYLIMTLTVLILFYALCEVFLFKNYYYLFFEGTFAITLIFLSIIGYFVVHFLNQIKFKILSRVENKEESIRCICKFLKEFNLEAYVNKDRNIVYTYWIEPFPLNYGVQLFFVFSKGNIYFNARRLDKKIVFKESKKLESILTALKSKLLDNSI